MALSRKQKIRDKLNAFLKRRPRREEDRVQRMVLPLPSHHHRHDDHHHPLPLQHDALPHPLTTMQHQHHQRDDMCALCAMTEEEEVMMKKREERMKTLLRERTMERIEREKMMERIEAEENREREREKEVEGEGGEEEKKGRKKLKKGKKKSFLHTLSMSSLCVGKRRTSLPSSSITDPDTPISYSVSASTLCSSSSSFSPPPLSWKNASTGVLEVPGQYAAHVHSKITAAPLSTPYFDALLTYIDDATATKTSPKNARRKTGSRFWISK